MRREYALSCINVNTMRCLTMKCSRSRFLEMNLSHRLKMAREHAGITQKQLEQRSGVSQQMISKIENGYQETSAYLVQLAVACNVRPEWLALGEGSMTVEKNVIKNEKIERALLLMQALPDYALDEAIKSVDSIKKLAEMAEKPKASSQ